MHEKQQQRDLWGLFAPSRESEASFIHPLQRIAKRLQFRDRIAAQTLSDRVLHGRFR